MTHSMTGFGKATGEYDGQAIAVEVSAVNHRYLDCNVRLPYVWSAIEPVVKNCVRKRLSRGKLSVSISRKSTGTTGKAVRFDEDMAKQYLDASKQIGQLLGTFENLSLDTLAKLEGVLVPEEPEEDLAAIEPIVVEVLERALGALETMRANEGKSLAEDVRARIELIRDGLGVIETRLPELTKLYEERLRARIAELTEEVSVTEDRIALEVAIMAEKSDVTEEVVRLKTHLDHAVELIEAKGAVGRKLDFLAQELGREINTLGVKTRDSDVAKEVLSMKAELEKIREQIQNIE